MHAPTKKLLFFMLIALNLGLFSCVRDVDFDQAEELQIEPEMAASLVYFNLSAATIGQLPNNSAGYPVQDSTQLSLFTEPFFDENLQAATFRFQFLNTIERSFSANIVMYNEQREPIDDIPITINAFKGRDTVKVDTIKTYDQTNIQIIKEMVSIEVNLTLESGTPELTPDSSGEIDLKSAGTFFLAIDAD